MDKPLAPETEFATKRPHPHLIPYGMLGRGRLNVTRPVPATQTQWTEARRAALGAWAGVEEVSGVPETSVGVLGGKPAPPASGSAIGSGFGGNHWPASTATLPRLSLDSLAKAEQ